MFAKFFLEGEPSNFVLGLAAAMLLLVGLGIAGAIARAKGHKDDGGE
jgi:hypothetical protein